MKTHISLFSAVLIFVCCNSNGKQSQGAFTRTPENFTVTDLEAKVIFLDTLYRDKAYKLQLETLNEPIGEEQERNTVLTLYRDKNKKDSIILRDTISSEAQEVKFEDFNNDQVKDILIQNYSDVRSNWTYHLYLVDLKADAIKKVKGFEEIKNPKYLPKHNLIDNLAMSGKNWTSFYEIQGDTIKDFEIVVYEEGYGKTYKKEYSKALTKILKEKSER